MAKRNLRIARIFQTLYRVYDTYKTQNDSTLSGVVVALVENIIRLERARRREEKNKQATAVRLQKWIKSISVRGDDCQSSQSRKILYGNCEFLGFSLFLLQTRKKENEKKENNYIFGHIIVRIHIRECSPTQDVNKMHSTR